MYIFWYEGEMRDRTPASKLKIIGEIQESRGNSRKFGLSFLTRMLPPENNVKLRLIKQRGCGNERAKVCSGVLLAVSEVTETSVQRCHSQFVRDEEFSLECRGTSEMHSFSDIWIAFTVMNRRGASEGVPYLV